MARPGSSSLSNYHIPSDPTLTTMAYSISHCATSVPAKRPALPDTEPSRLSRSMTADDPASKHLLLKNLSLPPAPASTRRRVNPDSLAIRLGPELVAELERYVKPGAVEMPSFAIRQDIQMRFNVDRRHIYDWFHSKGLRVTKEDKRATVEQKTDAMRMHRRIRRGAVPVLPKERARTNMAEDTHSVLVVPAPPVAPPVPPATISTSTIGPVTHGGQPAPPRLFTSTPVNYIIWRINSALNLPPRPPPGSSRTFRDLEIDSVCPIFDHTILNQIQRESYYNTLDRILGPADGIQEGVGSYKAHMERQIGIYYGRLLPSHSFSPDCDPNATSTIETFSPQLTSPAVNDCTTFLHGPELEYPSDESVCDVSASCDVSTDLTAYSPEDCNTWTPEVLAAMVSCVFPGLSSSSPVDDQTIMEIDPRPQPKTVSFAPDNQFHPSSTFSFSQPIGLIFNSSSSSLAGALDELPYLCVETEQETRRKSKDWARPRIGRARAYSGGGGI
ncbi:hypothetical protein V8D89_010265 [Ganoderma adspersum]